MNLILAPLSLLLLRRSPEVCGLMPDGWAQLPEDDSPKLQKKATSEEREDSDVRRFWPLLLFAFFYALMFGGCDFYMVEMVGEAIGSNPEVSVAYSKVWSDAFFFFSV